MLWKELAFFYSKNRVLVIASLETMKINLRSNYS